MSFGHVILCFAQTGQVYGWLETGIMASCCAIMTKPTDLHNC